MHTAQCGNVYIGRQPGGRKAMGNIWKFNLALSGKTLLLSAELENICIDTSGDILVIIKLKGHKANRCFLVGDKSEFSVAIQRSRA